MFRGQNCQFLENIETFKYLMRLHYYKNTTKTSLTPNRPDIHFLYDVLISSKFSHALFALWIFYHRFYRNLASCMCDPIRKGWFVKLLCLISSCIDSPKFSKILVQNSSKVLLEKSTHRSKQPKNLQKSIHFEYYISTNHKKFHLQIVNILFVIDLQNNFEF